MAADPIHDSHALDCPVCGVRLTEFRYRRHGYFVCSEACRDVVVVIDAQTVAEDFRPWSEEFLGTLGAFAGDIPRPGQDSDALTSNGRKDD